MQEKLDLIEDDIKFCRDFYKHNNYKILDCCKDCKYSYYFSENELYCKKIQENIKSEVIKIAEVRENEVCDLFESDIKDWSKI